MIKDEYEINTKTCALVAKKANETLIIEGEQPSISLKTPKEHLDHSCEYYGSSLEGRLSGSKSLLGMCYKLPVIVEESKEIIFFPTSSYNNEDCSWIALNNIGSYEDDGHNTIVHFNNGQTCAFDISLESFENQVLRASKLLLILRNRKNA